MEVMLFHAHSGVRYLVLLTGVIALIASIIAATRGGNGPDVILARIFTGVLDLQVLLGILLVFVRPFYGQLVGHIILMVAAAAIAHIGSTRAKKQTDRAAASRLRAISIGVALLAMAAGIMAIGRSILGSGMAV